MVIIEAISQILEYVIRSQSSVGRVFDSSGYKVNSHPTRTYDGPTVALIRNTESRSGNQIHRTPDFAKYRQEFAAGRIHRFKLGKFAKIRTKKDN